MHLRQQVTTDTLLHIDCMLHVVLLCCVFWSIRILHFFRIPPSSEPQYSPLQFSTVQYIEVQTSTDQYSPVQPSRAQ